MAPPENRPFCLAAFPFSFWQKSVILLRIEIDATGFQGGRAPSAPEAPPFSRLCGAQANHFDEVTHVPDALRRKAAL